MQDLWMGVIATFMVSVSLVGVHRWLAIKKKVLDVPNGRSSHYVPTPRAGGVVFVLVALGLFIASHMRGDITEWMFLSVCPVFVIALAGLMDDVRQLKASTRLIIQMLAVACTIFILYASVPFSLWGMPIVVLGPFSLLAMVWCTNVYNFMDGTDGLAGLQSLLVLTLACLLYAFSGQMELAKLIFLINIGIGGFLVWNWPGAKVFMGDVGSGFLGAFIGWIALVGLVFDISPLVWLLASFTFIFDATITLLRRMMGKFAWMSAHRSHAYQRCHQMGWSHLKILSVYGSLMFLNGVLALTGFFMASYIPFLILTFGLHVFLYLKLENVYPLEEAELTLGRDL